MEQFTGVYFCMRLVKMTSIRCYWETYMIYDVARLLPKEFHSIDKIMVAFKRRSFLKQYLPSKSNKLEFTVWGRIGISGFLYDFDIYQGKMTRTHGDSNTRRVGSPLFFKCHLH